VFLGFSLKGFLKMERYVEWEFIGRQGMERYVEWEFIGRQRKDNFLAAEAVAIIMDEDDCVPAVVTADIAKRAAERLGDGFDGQSVLALVENCRFWRVEKKKERPPILRSSEVVQALFDPAGDASTFAERRAFANAGAFGAAWAHLTDEKRLWLIEWAKKYGAEIRTGK